MPRALPAISFVAPLLRWFARHGRNLPWRDTRDPYRVWVSEVMLQQTQVDRVLEFYRRFLEAFPTVQALAAARWPQVLAAWRGLGYYRRPRNMMATAKAIAGGGGLFPSTVEGLEALPGIGPYTARAVAVFAFEQDELVLDTNVRRVLGRLLRLPEKGVDEKLLAMKQAIVPRGKAWPLHQAFMDLGATICTAAAPNCPACPLGRSCPSVAAMAKRAGSKNSTTRKHRRSPSPFPLPSRERVAEAPQQTAGRCRIDVIDVAAAVIHRQGKILITTRPRGHLAGCWEFPGGKKHARESWRDCLKREILEELGIEVAVRPHDWEAQHASDDRTVRIRFHRCSILRGSPEPNDGQELRWVVPSELPRFRFPPADRSIVKELAAARFVDPQAARSNTFTAAAERAKRKNVTRP